MTHELDEVRRIALSLDRALDELHFAELALARAQAKVKRLKERRDKVISTVSQTASVS